MAKRSKRYREARPRPSTATSSTSRARRSALLKSLPPAKFDETVEVAVRLGIDPKKSDQLVRGAVSLPKGLGKKVRSSSSPRATRPRRPQAAGADEVGADDLAKQIARRLDRLRRRDRQPRHDEARRQARQSARPAGQDAEPKSGTVTPDVGKAVREFKAGKVEFRTDAGGNVHAPVGKRSFSAEDLEANLTAFLDHAGRLRPPAVKGEFLRKVSVSTTMGPGAWIQLRSLDPCLTSSNELVIGRVRGEPSPQAEGLLLVSMRRPDGRGVGERCAATLRQSGAWAAHGRELARRSACWPRAGYEVGPRRWSGQRRRSPTARPRPRSRAAKVVTKSELKEGRQGQACARRRARGQRCSARADAAALADVPDSRPLRAQLVGLHRRRRCAASAASSPACRAGWRACSRPAPTRPEPRGAGAERGRAAPSEAAAP